MVNVAGATSYLIGKELAVTKSKSFADKTSAADKSIGFDYQYFYFLLKVLNLKSGQTVGLEVMDDVHTKLNADLNIFYQLKHTTQKTAAGGAASLSQLDGDMWKTISNWSKLISDPVDGRGLTAQQLQFARKSEFHLVSNKSKSTGNTFQRDIEKLQRGDLSFLDFKKTLKGLPLTTKDEGIKEYIEDFLALDDKVLEEFAGKIRFELEVDDVISLIKRSLKEKLIDEARIDDTYKRLDSSIREDNYIAVKAGQLIEISFDNFYARYRKIFQDARSTKLSNPKFEPVIPDNIFSQVFILRLVEIGAISLMDEDEAFRLTTDKLELASRLIHWQQTGEVVHYEIEELHAEVMTSWLNEFSSAFQACDAAEIEKIGRTILGTLRRQKFSLSNEPLSVRMSNGEVYQMSDDGHIGWHRDWKSK